jgi:hypothetical protein
MSDLEARVAAIESALALPGQSGVTSSLEVAKLEDTVRKLEDTVRKQAYRIQHLVRGYEAKCKEVEDLKARSS